MIITFHNLRLNLELDKKNLLIENPHLNHGIIKNLFLKISNFFNFSP